MKFASRILSLAILVSLTLFYMSCKEDGPDKKPETEIQFEKLAGNWDVTTATLEGAPPALDHSNVVLKISGSATGINYVVENRPAGPSAWPAEGVFTFGPTVATQLVRDDDVIITYSVTENTLTLDFDFNGTPYTAGRVENVSGQWHFEFQKQ